MSEEVEIRVYTTEDGVELTSFVPVKRKTGFWENLKNIFRRSEIKPYVKVRDFNNCDSDKGNKPKPGVEAGLKITF